jgi:hypothetical protein
MRHPRETSIASEFFPETRADRPKKHYRPETDLTIIIASEYEEARDVDPSGTLLSPASLAFLPAGPHASAPI